MKTDLISVTREGDGLRKLLDKVELIALYADMNRREASNMALLTEEMLLAMDDILKSYDSSLWMELTEKTMSVHLCVEAMTDYSHKEKLIALSTSGKNAKPKGFLGMVSAGLEAILVGDSDALSYMPAWHGYDMYGATLDSICYDLDYETYKRSVSDEAETETDELSGIEKTMIDALADDLAVSVRNGRIELVATKNLK